MQIIFGKNGQLATRLSLLYPNAQVLGHEDVDFSQLDQVSNWEPPAGVKVIFNCAAYTQVDKAEEQREMALNINAEAPGILARKCAKLGISFIHISTDYVFDGKKKEQGWVEVDSTSPVNFYGQTKLLGEEMVLKSRCHGLVVRTSWVFGGPSKNFVDTMLALAMDREELNIVNDQFGCPTFASDLARAIENIVEGPHFNSDAMDIIHITNQNWCSWKLLADHVFKTAFKRGWPLKLKSVHGVASDQYPTPAVRPHWSVLSDEKLRSKYNIQMQSWQSAVESYLSEKQVPIAK